MAIDMTARLDEETKKAQPFQAAAMQQDFSPAVPTLGTGLQGMSRVISTSGVSAPNPDTGFVTGATPGAMPKPIAGPGRDESGIITADSAPHAYANDMQRSGGVFGGVDMAGVNSIMARENKARSEMIDLSIKANGGNGVAILGDGGVEAANAEKTARWRQDELMDKVRSSPVLAGVAQGIVSGNSQLAVENMRQQNNVGVEMARLGLTARGQDLNAQSDTNRNAVTMRGQDIGANTDAVRLGIDQQRLGIQQQDANRAGDKWAIEKGVVQGQAQDELAESSRKVALLSVEMQKFNVEKLLGLRGMAMDSAIKYISALASGQDIASKVIGVGYDAQSKLISAASSFYNARSQAAETMSKVAQYNNSTQLEAAAKNQMADMDMVKNKLNALLTDCEVIGRAMTALYNNLHVGSTMSTQLAGSIVQ